MKTDHSIQIKALRDRAETLRRMAEPTHGNAGNYAFSVNYALAADLLQMHDETGISLDRWENGLEFVSLHLRWVGTGIGIEPNGA